MQNSGEEDDVVAATAQGEAEECEGKKEVVQREDGGDEGAVTEVSCIN